MEISSATSSMKWNKDDGDENSKKQVKQESFEDLNKPGTWSDKKNETLKEELICVDNWFWVSFLMLFSFSW